MPSGPVRGDRLEELRAAIESTHRALGTMRWRTARLCHEPSEDRLLRELHVVSKALQELLRAAESLAAPTASPGPPDGIRDRRGQMFQMAE
ncbi:hypothetical protein [Embleya sp. NPDC059259]|uniref:hypothetical protein n=1 Tax=unclassified Embleya TaxID=2699296 RepID=UPI0036CA4EBB